MTEGSFTPENCVFCAELKEPSRFGSYYPTKWPYEDRIIWRGRHAWCVPGYGPQVFPYILLLTQRHVRSCSEVSGTEREDVFRCLEFLRTSGIYPSFGLTVFEHGGCDPLESCMEHFHLHVVDGSIDLARFVAPLNAEAREIRALSSFNLEGRYLLVGYYRGEGRIDARVVSGYRSASQFFRRALAALNGSIEWDWRTGMNPDLMLRVLRYFRPRIKPSGQGMRSVSTHTTVPSEKVERSPDPPESDSTAGVVR